MDEDTKTPEPPKKTVMDAANATADAVVTMMKTNKWAFAQAWTIIKDAMDRQQHYQDNQVALLVNGFSDKEIQSEDDDLDDLAEDLGLDDSEMAVN